MEDYSIIEKLPEVPKAIVEAVNNDKLVVFIGAGVSRIIGCMGWSQLASNLINICFTSQNKYNTGTCISFKEKESLEQNYDHKKVITICHDILCKQNGLEKVFFEEFNKSLESNEEKEVENDIYKEIFGLRGINITTNADKHYDKYFLEANRIFNINEFSPFSIERNKLYQIHGSQDNRDSLVFTVPEYIQRYNNQKFKDFLKKVFTDYTVLFLGYGMSEFELLDFLITKLGSINENKEIKHYTLLPFYSGEENILSFEQSYYNLMGIQVIGYEKDEKGFQQLYDVLRKWNAEINQTSTYTYDSYKEIDDLVNCSMTKGEIDKILQIIANDIAQENHLFRTLSSIKDPFPLFNPLKDAGYFNPDKNPQPIEVKNQKGYFTIHHWNVLGYLENVAKKNNIKPSKKITDLLIHIINSIIEYKTEKDERINNYRTDWILSKIIFLLPLEYIHKKHVEFIRTALQSKWGASLISSEIGESIIPAVLKKDAKELLLQVLDVVFDYKVLERSYSDKYVSIIEKHWFTEALRQHKGSIFKLCGKEALEIVMNKMQNIIEDDKSQFNNIWIPTIEDHSQTSFPDRYECQLVYFIRDFYEMSNFQDISEKIQGLIRQEHPIFQRLALHIINYHYTSLFSIFWDWSKNPLEVSSVKHELYELLNNNCKSFSSEQIDQIIKWIEEKEYYIPDEYKDDKIITDRIIAYSKKEWLSALLNANNDKIQSLYNKYNSINPATLDHPGFVSWSEIKVGSESPIKEKELELLSKSPEEMVEYLNNFKEKGGLKDPSIGGLIRTLNKYVSEKPEKFTEHLNLFLKAKRIYQHALLCGLTNAWESERVIDWLATFKFINGILHSNGFWEENNSEENYHYRDRIITQIADLINKGTINDQHAFNSRYLPEAEKILLLLVEKAESKHQKMHDIITSVLNSNRGKIFTAMINYSLRNARINKKDVEDKWIDSIKNKFTKCLDRSIESSLDFSVVVGEYLPNLYYLDKKWVISNLNEIFPKDNNEYWEASFTGYLFYSSTVYSHIYTLLSENRHYQKALAIDFKDDHLNERVAQHICVGYLEGWEKFENPDSLINLLIRSNNTKHLSAVINFFWMQRKNITEKAKTLIKPLWEQLFNRLVKEKENADYLNLISDTSKFLVLVDEIDDDIFKWLELSAKYINVNFNSPFFIEYLLKHVDKTPEKVADLFLDILNSGFYPEYKKEHILGIISKINKNDMTVKATRICNFYLNKGFEFTRPILEEIKNGSKE